MKITISKSKTELGRKAAAAAAELIRKAIKENDRANIIVPAGASQIEMLDELIKQDIDWSKVTAFHLDEYIGMSEKHPASFRKYIKERIVNKVPLKNIHYVNGENNPDAECLRLGKIIKEYPIDVVFVGIGENGHLAFNDPPANFETEEAFLVVNLDEGCRRQQMGEGWFKTMDEVPNQAISMSIKQIMKSKNIICSVPDKRKAKAVKNALEGPISPTVPATILQDHDAVLMYLDKDSASLLSQ